MVWHGYRYVERLTLTHRAYMRSDICLQIIYLIYIYIYIHVPLRLLLLLLLLLLLPLVIVGTITNFFTQRIQIYCCILIILFPLQYYFFCQFKHLLGICALIFYNFNWKLLSNRPVERHTKLFILRRWNTIFGFKFFVLFFCFFTFLRWTQLKHPPCGKNNTQIKKQKQSIRKWKHKINQIEYVYGYDVWINVSDFICTTQMLKYAHAIPIVCWIFLEFR